MFGYRTRKGTIMIRVLQDIKDRFTQTKKLQQEETALMSQIEQEEESIVSGNKRTLSNETFYRQSDATKELIRRGVR
jgi:hypothetical protein